MTWIRARPVRPFPSAKGDGLDVGGGYSGLYERPDIVAPTRLSASSPRRLRFQLGRVDGAKLGIGAVETLRRFLRQGEVDRGLREGPTTEELAKIKRLRREVADSQRTIEILKAATTFSSRKPTHEGGDDEIHRYPSGAVAGGGDVCGVGLSGTNLLRRRSLRFRPIHQHPLLRPARRSRDRRLDRKRRRFVRQCHGRSFERHLQSRARPPPRPLADQGEARVPIIKWVHWYNTARLHGEIGDIPPVEHETDWYRRHIPALNGRNPITRTA